MCVDHPRKPPSLSRALGLAARVGTMVVALAACRQDLTVAANSSLQGTHRVRDFHVPGGVTVTVTGDLSIDASGRVVIDGDVIAADESGADVRLTARNGRVEIAGSVHAGSGRHGRAESGNGHVVTANRPTDGGDIELSAPQGSIVIRGEVRAGQGGAGGGASATGAGPQYAESSPGGLGGQVVLTARDDIDVSGPASVIAGAGGDGGPASALVSQDDEERQAPPAANARAVAPAGGRAGDVKLSITSQTGTITIQATIRAGSAGGTGTAVATGREATSETRAASSGGRVTVDAPQQTQLLVFTPPDPGHGGVNGVPAGPPQSAAFGSISANATVGAGGDAGEVVELGATTRKGRGGSNGSALAKVGALDRSSPGRTVLDATPAPEHRAVLP